MSFSHSGLIFVNKAGLKFKGRLQGLSYIARLRQGYLTVTNALAYNTTVLAVVGNKLVCLSM